MKKRVALVMVVVMLAVSLVGCGSSSSSSSDTSGEASSDATQEVAKEETTETGSGERKLTIFAQNSISDYVDDYGEIAGFQAVADAMDIEIEWTMPTGTTADEQFNLMISSQELPDIIFYNFSSTSIKLQGLLDNGSAIDMDELIREYAPNYLAALEQDEVLMKQALSDSGTYQAIYKLEPDPARLVTGGLFIRDDLLAEYGLDIPVTIDDWYNVLTVFKENGYEAPLTLTTMSSMMSPEVMLGAYGASYSFYLDPDTNEVEYGPITDKYKEWLKEMNKWYEAGLIDTEYPTNGSTDIISNITSGKSVATVGPLSAVMGSALKSGKADNPDFSLAGCPWPVLEEGQTGYNMSDEVNVRVGGMGAVVTSACEDPILAVQYLDYFYTEEGDALVNWGIEGESYEVESDGSRQFTDLILNNPDGLTAAEAVAQYCLPSHGFTKAMDYDAWAQINLNMDEQYEANAIWSEGSTSLMLPNLELSTEENDDFNSIMNEIETYVAENEIKFISGAQDVDAEWDSYVSQLEKMGIETAIGYKRGAYEAYLAR